MRGESKVTFPTPEADVSGLPLSALQAVVLDTETTGLDVDKDRVVEFGAVKIENGNVVEKDSFSQLVSPGVPISDQSKQIHGLSDHDVAGAPAFPEAMQSFISKMNPTLVLGYSLGFDMGVLRAEHERHGIIWVPPRTLDVAHIVRVLSPVLPNYSLEVVCGWLGVSMEGRHRAMADAKGTAEAFLKMVSLLRKKNITTLAQLERQVRSLSAVIDEEARSGWHTPTASVGEMENIASLSRLDSFPYRHRVKEVMHEPRFIDEKSKLSEALHLMAELKSSSIFVKGKDGRVGIITERDVLRALKEKSDQALTEDLSFVIKERLISIKPEEYVYRAMLKMRRENIRHLAVESDKGAVVGILTPRILLKMRGDDAVQLGEEIEEAKTTEELGRVWQGLVAVANTLWLEDVDVRDIAGIISRELLAMTRRACEMAEAKMEQEGLGKAPAPYAMLVLGSGGRGESLLAMDQDNAIVYEGKEDDKVNAWMSELGKRVSDTLDATGIKYCKGGVMASNKDWRKDYVSWEKTVDDWVKRSRSEDFLSSDIFFDGVWVHGDRKLAERLFSGAREKVGASQVFLKFLALSASKVDSSLGMFGKVRTKGGRIDLKLRGTLPIFSAARVLALRHGLVERATADRLRMCKENGHAPCKIVESLIIAHRIFLAIILRQQLRDIKEGIEMGSEVDVKSLTSRESSSLKWALAKVPDVSVLLGTPV